MCKKSLSNPEASIITEIEIEDVHTVRPLNMWQIARAKRGRGIDGHKRWLAFSIGLTLR